MLTPVIYLNFKLFSRKIKDHYSHILPSYIAHLYIPLPSCLSCIIPQNALLSISPFLSILREGYSSSRKTTGLSFPPGCQITNPARSCPFPLQKSHYSLRLYLFSNRCQVCMLHSTSRPEY